MTDTNAPNVDSSGPQLAAGKSPRKGLVIALITSVVINLLFIGALAGRLINGPPPSPMPRHLGWMLRDLEPQLREQLRPQLEAHARQVKPLRRSMQQAQRDLKSALGTDPLDEAQLTAALLELRTASNNLQISMHAAMFTLVKQLEPAQRTRIAQFLSRSERGKQRRPSESDNHKD
jgi:uncharacterized membrane protein